MAKFATKKSGKSGFALATSKLYAYVLFVDRVTDQQRLMAFPP
jgi:hypothetical protein